MATLLVFTLRLLLRFLTAALFTDLGAAAFLWVDEILLFDPLGAAELLLGCA
jgi:hypothetical protein